MPTPSETTVAQSAPIDRPQSPRSRLASCPPEDDRRHSAMHDERVSRVDTPQPQSQTQSLPRAENAASPAIGDSRGSSEREGLTPEPDAPDSASDNIPIPVERSKAEHIEDAGFPSSPLATTPEATSDSDARLAQSMSATAISSPSAPSPEYLYFPDAHREKTRSANSTTSFLRPGSKFRGTQQSDRQVYDVQVEIKDVDLAESFLCGYLRIQGLTDDHPTLTTFFEGEIIGPKYHFKTGHSSWNSSEKIDLQHWARFPAWRPLAKSSKHPNFTLKGYQQREHLFMRWKEYFLVPDHRVKTITGASFEGFYYICFNQCSGSVSGIYFHAKSEKYQQLELKHVDDRGCLPAVEFR